MTQRNVTGDVGARKAVRIPAAAVNKLIDRVQVHASRVPDLPAVLTARARTHFDYVLKCSGEAAVADTSSTNDQFAIDMATERLMPKAKEEIWAHEGWMMMQTMNDVDRMVLPMLKAMVDSACSPHSRRFASDEACRRVFWRAVRSRVDGTMFIMIGDLVDTNDQSAGRQQALVVAQNVVMGVLQYFEDTYNGICAYWLESLNALSRTLDPVAGTVYVQSLTASANRMINQIVERSQYVFKKHMESGEGKLSSIEAFRLLWDCTYTDKKFNIPFACDAEPAVYELIAADLRQVVSEEYDAEVGSADNFQF